MCVRAALRGFIVVEFAANTPHLSVEELDEGPKEIGKVGLETGVEKDARQSFDGKLQWEGRGVRRGQWTPVWLVINGNSSRRREEGIVAT